MRCIPLLIIAVFLFSCSNSETQEEPQPEPANPLIELLFPSAEHHFMNFSIGDSLSVVLSDLQGDITHQTKKEVRAAMDLVPEDSSRLEVRYKFDNGLLYDIQADIYARSTLQAGDYFGRLSAYYDEQYGHSSSAQDYITWTTKTPDNSNTIEIALINASDDHDFALVSVTYYVRWGY